MMENTMINNELQQRQLESLVQAPTELDLEKERKNKEYLKY